MIKKITISVFTFAFLILISGCSKDEPVTAADQNDGNLQKINSCEGCHTNYEVLKAVYTPDEDTGGGGGCGGDAPHIEPYDRVYLGGEDYHEFKQTMHGKMECTDCHNGVGNTEDKETAHSGDFIAHPSDIPDQKCVPCHDNIVSGTHNSLHEQGWGQKNMVAGRAGYNSISEMSEMMQEGYEHNCGKCHAGCGDCHVNRPTAGGGGLYKSHRFLKTPNMRDNCVTCHVSRGGHAYFGVATGTVPDVHLTEAQFECVNCHSKNEIHGDGVKYNHRYQMALLPSCSNCHSNLANVNVYHSVHIESFNCNVCHSQDYNNCGSCHIGGEGARIASYQGFKIGMNPIPETKPYKLATLRRSLSKHDSWKEYGIEHLSNFDVAPTWKYTTPHNIIRWTSRTQVEEGKPCYDACHIIKEDDTYRNKELYLFKSDLEEWEYEASKNIIVDDKLPSSWNIN